MARDWVLARGAGHAGPIRTLGACRPDGPVRATRGGMHRIALVARDAPARGALAQYLTSAGFDVHAYSELEVASSFAALVLIEEPEATETTAALIARIRNRIKLAKPPRIVVITTRARALRELAIAHPARLFVLPAPAFGWDVVDTLRGSSPRRPRGA